MDTANDAPLHATLCNASHLFGGRYSPVIPDMQRDYCWGLEAVSHGAEAQKCALFVESLMRLHQIGARQISIGLIYGYESPRSSHTLCIIDGQQRLTTLYLLMGMIYRRIPDTPIGPRFRSFLVSESHDGDITPRLQYESKSETMYFLSDLVTKFFLSRAGRLSQIERSKWYFKSYDADTNARAFLGAIRCIDASIEKELAENPGFDFEEFARFIAEEALFRCFDLGSRVVAERAFITINTTGHPLTLAQNLRALAFAYVDEADSQPMARFWNEMEDWFFRRRPMSMDVFLRRAISTFADGGKPDSNFLLADLPGIFDAYARCVGCGVEMEREFVFAPMMHYALRFGPQAKDCDIERLGHLLAYYSSCQKTGATDRQQAMDIALRMPSPSLDSLLSMRHIPSKILNEEEMTKLRLMADFDFDAELMDILRHAEAHPMLKGRVAKVIAWGKVKGGDFDIERFRHYVDRIYELWDTEIDRRDDLDPLRRALLTLRHRAYPIVRRGDIVLSLCWKDYDWQRLLSDAPGLIRQLIDHTENLSLEELALRFSDKDCPYWFIIKDPNALEGCRKRQLLRPCPPFIGIYYLHASRTQWWIDGRRLRVSASGPWSTPKPHGQSTLVLDHATLNATISLAYTPDAVCPYRVDLYRRQDSTKEKTDLKEVAESLAHPLRYDRAAHRFSSPCPDSAHAIARIEEIMQRM